MLETDMIVMCSDIFCDDANISLYIPVWIQQSVFIMFLMFPIDKSKNPSPPATCHSHEIVTISKKQLSS